jgi:cell division protein FtsQ
MRLLMQPSKSSTKTPVRTRPVSRLQRRLMRTGAAVLAVAFIGGGAAWLVHSGAAAHAAEAGWAEVAQSGRFVGLEVGSVTVEGRNRVSRPAILEALGVRRGTAILAVDLDAARERLEALPWVRSAAIERQLPDMLHVQLVERQPLAFWQRQGKLELIDTEGKVIPTDHLDRYGALLVLVGDDAPPKGAALLALLDGEPELKSHVAAAVRVGGRRWNLHLDNGIDVELPEEDPESAWHRLAAIERSDQVLQREIQAVDLRLPDRLVLRLPPEPPKASAAHKKGRPPGKTT